MTTLHLRAIATRGRLLGTAAGGLLMILLGVALLVDDASRGTVLDMIENAGLQLLVPVVSLSFATSVLGDPAEDGSLGYHLLVPRPRWQLAVPAIAAAWLVVVPLCVVPLVVTAWVNDLPLRMLVGIGVAAGVGAATYACLFTALGLLVRRAMLYGLFYVVIWEGIVGGLAEGLSRGSIRVHVQSLLMALMDRGVPRFGVEGGTAALVLGALLVAGAALTTLALRTHVART